MSRCLAAVALLMAAACGSNSAPEWSADGALAVTMREAAIEVLITF